MNIHLYNWLDKVEGLPVGTTVKNIKKEFKRQGYKKIKSQITDIWKEANGRK